MLSTCALLYCHLWPAWLYRILSHYLAIGTIFGKKYENKMIVMTSSTILSETFPILRRNEQHTSTNLHRSSSSVSVTLIRFQLKVNVVDRFSKNTQISDFTKICLEGAKLYMWIDRRTDGRKNYRYDENSRYSQFCECP